MRQTILRSAGVLYRLVCHVYTLHPGWIIDDKKKNDINRILRQTTPHKSSEAQVPQHPTHKCDVLRKISHES